MKFISKKFDELSNCEVYEILKARMQVFLLEQNIVCLDTDDVDYDSVHCFLEDNGKIIGYLRAFYSDEDTVTVGRVLTVVHKKGYGKVLMEKSIAVIKDRMPCRAITLHSQCQAAGFYEKFGFTACSDMFLEEGVPHVEMKLLL